MSDLIELLRAKQGEEESDGAFAARMGVNRETWRRIRTGLMVPGPRTLRGIMAAFPDLQGQAMAFFLSPNAIKRAETDSKRASGRFDGEISA